MPFGVQTNHTVLLKCAILYLICLSVYNEKKEKMFVLFFGYPAYPMKVLQNKGFGCYPSTSL